MEIKLITIVAVISLLLAHTRHSLYLTMAQQEAEIKLQGDRELREWMEHAETIMIGSGG